MRVNISKVLNSCFCKTTIQMELLQNRVRTIILEELPCRSFSSNFGMLKLDKITLGLGLKQYCIPKNCLDRQQESRHYDYRTEHLQNQHHNVCLSSPIEIHCFQSCNCSIFFSHKTPSLYFLMETLFGFWPQSVPPQQYSFGFQIKACCFSFCPFIFKIICHTY